MLPGPARCPRARAKRSLRASGVGTALFLIASADADTLVTPPGAPCVIRATVGGCPGHEWGGYDGSVVPAACPVKFLQDPVCEVLAPEDQLRSLDDEGGCSASWLAGTPESDGVQSFVAAVPAASPLALVRVTGGASRSTDAISFSFDLVRRPVETMVRQVDPLRPRMMFAAHENGWGGIAMVGMTDRVEVRVPIVLEQACTLHARSRILADDVRTNGRGFGSRISWRLESAPDRSDFQYGLPLFHPDQEASIDEARHPQVDIALGSVDAQPVQAGAYTLVAIFEGAGRGFVGLNACESAQGAWTAHESAFVHVSTTRPTDVDGSNEVDYGDVAFVLLDYGPCPGNCLTDIDASGEVDFGDVAMVLLDFGS